MTPEQVVSLGPAFTAYLRDFEDYFGNDLLLRQVIREAVSRIELQSGAPKLRREDTLRRDGRGHPPSPAVRAPCAARQAVQ